MKLKNHRQEWGLAHPPSRFPVLWNLVLVSIAITFLPTLGLVPSLTKWKLSLLSEVVYTLTFLVSRLPNSLIPRSSPVPQWVLNRPYTIYWYHFQCLCCHQRSIMIMIVLSYIAPMTPFMDSCGFEAVLQLWAGKWWILLEWEGPQRDSTLFCQLTMMQPHQRQEESGNTFLTTTYNTDNKGR